MEEKVCVVLDTGLHPFVFGQQDREHVTAEAVVGDGIAHGRTDEFEGAAPRGCVQHLRNQGLFSNGGGDLAGAGFEAAGAGVGGVDGGEVEQVPGAQAAFLAALGVGGARAGWTSDGLDGGAGVFECGDLGEGGRGVGDEGVQEGGGADVGVGGAADLAAVGGEYDAPR